MSASSSSISYDLLRDVAIDTQIELQSFRISFDAPMVAPELALDLVEQPAEIRSISGTDFWSDWMPLWFLRKHLAQAKIKSTAASITEDELKKILYHAAVDQCGSSSLKQVKRAMYAWRSLSYIAKYNIDLPLKEVLELTQKALVRELRLSEKKLNYIILTLSYFILHRKVFLNEAMETYFNFAIDRLMQAEPRYVYAESIMAALAARMHFVTVAPLEAYHLAYIQDSLKAVDFSIPGSVKHYEVFGNAWINLFLNEKTELRRAKNFLKAGQPLSKSQLTYALHRAKYAGSYHVRVKATQIIVLAIAKNQQFIDIKELVDTLRQHLADDEFKSRTYALQAVNLLLQDSRFDDYRKKFKTELEKALSYQRILALQALKSHLDLHFCTELENKEIWISYIDNIIADSAIENKELIRLAVTVRNLLTGELSLARLNDYIRSSMRGDILPESLVRKIEAEISNNIIIDNNAIYKHLLILANVTNYGESLLPSTISNILECFTVNSRNEMIEVTLHLLANSIGDHSDMILTDSFFATLIAIFDRESMFFSLCYFLGTWFDYAAVITHSHFLQLALSKLMQQVLREDNDDHRNKLAQVIGKAVKKSFICNEFLLADIMNVFMYVKDENEMLAWIQIMTLTIRRSDYQVFMASSMFKKLIYLALSIFKNHGYYNNSHDIVESNDALKLLITYVNVANKDSMYENIDFILTLLQSHANHDLLLPLLYKLNERQYDLPQGVIPYIIRYDAQKLPKSLRHDEVSLVRQATTRRAEDKHNILTEKYKKLILKKDLDKLMAEAKELNSTNEVVMDILNSGDVQEIINYAKSLRHSSATIGLHPNHAPYSVDSSIKVWNKVDVRFWLTTFSKYSIQTVINNNQLFAELIAVLVRNCELSYKKPRMAQVFAVILILRGKQPQRALLTEIISGEGKSLIITMLSMINSLFAVNIDNITSSPVLARGDADKFANCYKSWNTKSAYNDAENEKQGEKTCYQHKVIYHYGPHFQADILHENKHLNRRGYGVAISDEFDSALLDRNNKHTILSRDSNTLYQLTPLLFAIWHELQMLLARNQSLQRQDREIIKQEIISKTSKLIKGEDFINIPSFLKKFVLQQHPLWIEHAIAAHFDYHRDMHYTIENQQGKLLIAPINMDNGVRERGTSWNEGLQQLIEIKEGLAVSALGHMHSVETNMATFMRYKGNFFGLSGSIGEIKTQQLINDVYQADFLKIPTFAVSQLTVEPGMIAKDRESWLERVSTKAIDENRNGRAVLIICENIKMVRLVYDRIKQQSYNNKLHRYDDDATDQADFLLYPLTGDTIIVATPLGGRGFDTELTQSVLERRGLSTIVTYMPLSKRNERQFSFRSARRGEPGSVQFIVNADDIKQRFHMGDDAIAAFEQDFEMLLECRDRHEQHSLDIMRDVDMLWVKNISDIFRYYADYKRHLNELDKVMLKKSWRYKSLAELQIKAKRLAVEERFGLW